MATATKQYNGGTRLLVRTTSPAPTVVGKTFTRLKDVDEDGNMELNGFETNTSLQDRAEAMRRYTF